jgi:hypothetical protein
MRIRRASTVNGNGRRIQAAGGKFEHGLNLVSRDMKLLNNFLYARTRLKIFKTLATGILVPRNTHAPLRRSATLSTAGHCDQSRVDVAMILRSFS